MSEKTETKTEKSDLDILYLIHSRLENNYGEDTNTEYLVRLRAIMAATPPERITNP